VLSVLFLFAIVLSVLLFSTSIGIFMFFFSHVNLTFLQMWSRINH
jgi:hypothetical protein